jgi:hypothetical protein
MDAAEFTAEDRAATHTLGPHYEAAHRVARKVMEGFEAEAFKPLVDKLAEAFAERLWTDLETGLLSDVEMNLQGTIWRMADQIMLALVTGEQWAIERYVLKPGAFTDAAKVRAAIFKHCNTEAAALRVAELEAEVKSLTEDLARTRRGW